MPASSSTSGSRGRKVPAPESKFHAGEPVYAWHAEGGCWRKAIIIATERPPPILPREEVATTVTEREAYIHWEGFDRRLDRWIGYKHLAKRSVEASLKGPVSCSDEEPDDTHAGLDADYLKEHQEQTKFKTINHIALGRYLVDAWYFSPYPVEVQNTDILHLCSFCLAFFKFREELVKHNQRCTARHPPGNEVFRDPIRKLSMWEVDGGVSRIYCENVCYLSKLFLDHKTLRHPVHLFLFYVLTELAEDGHHIVGYFSKEKYSRNNVSCILSLPQYQKKGYGKFLIHFSYALAVKEGRLGTPERPLSDLGKASYLNYWRQVLLQELTGQKELDIDAVSRKYSFEPNDIKMCLKESDILVKDESGASNPGAEGCPVEAAWTYCYLPPEYLQLLSMKLGNPPPSINPHDLHWVPYDPFMGPFEYSADA
eukprot:Protomagalhaensia_sp_Gyna_25__3378@NODE_304_length_3981_cov_24_902334_g235_i0_p2_GENE_NODE_304_length_3981_cov_24_902334_g235_i0NODE_304_length_3981_cov_24_902334_g235_i0_p2_ORF_typecomplete_len426_score79_88MOZ_SAS/PF01853_18/3_6e67zfMYST/PF17772_1/7_2e18Tudorknot/PF11717_8/3_7e08Tudorknot/PF11717_8/6_5e03Acetyltransf_7/PF13508_7/0_0039Acetyltransf_10/PF13673_7/0_0067Acetyltransf_1/PF00583_25/0_032_NODE_304_length_3981_cov_24_902334_g235_i08042081